MLTALGVYEREAVKASMRALLAKSPREMRFFDEEFDEFFVGEEVIIERTAQQVQVERARAHTIQETKDEFGIYELPDEIAEAYSSVPEERKQWLRDMISRVHDSDRVLPLAEDYVKRIATGWLASGAGKGLEPKEEKEEVDLLHKNLTAITEEEIPRALQLIETLVRRINSAAERRYRRSGRSGLPDLRATIHNSLRTGGVPVHPQYKKRPQSSRRVVVLCDVSESMYRFSGFALRFITALGNTASKTSAYIFSEGVEEIAIDGIADFETTVRASELWRRGTDVGSALDYVLAASPPVLGASALLIVLSDARTVNMNYALEALERAERVSRAILWMNPDDTTTGSAKRLAQYCSMLSCATLDELAAACNKVTTV